MIAPFVARQRALKTCPDRRCRRSRQCRAEVSGTPCVKTHESADRYRHRLAMKLDRLVRELPRDPTAPDPADPDYAYKVELRMAELLRAFEERKREFEQA